MNYNTVIEYKHTEELKEKKNTPDTLTCALTILHTKVQNTSESNNQHSLIRLGE